MSTFGDNLIQSIQEAVAHTKRSGTAILHETLSPREVRGRAKFIQPQMAPLLGMFLFDYRK